MAFYCYLANTNMQSITLPDKEAKAFRALCDSLGVTTQRYYSTTEKKTRFDGKGEDFTSAVQLFKESK